MNAITFGSIQSIAVDPSWHRDAGLRLLVTDYKGIQTSFLIWDLPDELRQRIVASFGEQPSAVRPPLMQAAE